MPQVSIPIIDQLVHPSFILLTRVALPGNPYSAVLAIAPPQNPLVALTYGLVWKINFVPTNYSRKLGAPDIYEPLCQIVSHYTDLSGQDIIQQIEDVTFSPYPYIWREPLPTLISLYPQPGVLFDAYWLQT